jgi:Lantibiotic biosynthesis dehydratase C-term
MTMTLRTCQPAHGQAGGRDWLHARLHIGRPMQDMVLAERLPAVLESLPAGVDWWCFLRDAGPDPHLRLSFGGDPGPLWTDLLGVLRRWMGELAAAGLATRLTVDACPPIGGDPRTVAAADQALQADSDAVLGQLRLSQANAFAIGPDALAELGRHDIAQAFSRDPRRSSANLAAPGLRMLTYWWEARAAAMQRYGDRIRQQAAANDDPQLAPTVLNDLQRMHINRVLGTWSDHSTRPPTPPSPRSLRSLR